MYESRHIALAGSMTLLVNLCHAGPLDGLFGGQATAKAASPAAASVKRLGDTELSCAQLYAEVQQLEALSAKSQGDATAQPSSEAGSRMLSGLAQSLLGAAPLFGSGGRGSTVAGMVAQQAAQQVATNQALQGAQQAQQAQMDAATAAQRRDHLVELFEGKRCKVSQLKK